MRAYAHLRTFNPTLGKFSTWLYQIARNVARTHLGKESRRPQTEDLYEDETIEQRLPETRRDAAPEATLIAADDERSCATPWPTSRKRCAPRSRCAFSIISNIRRSQTRCKCRSATSRR